jgi:hypothetical protein
VATGYDVRARRDSMRGHIKGGALPMAELKDAADQFAKDLAAQNIAGLMMAFTPNGMMKAMAMQGQMAAAGPQPALAGFDVNITGDNTVDVVLKNANGEAVVQTTWIEDAATSAWKVDDIGLKV